MSDQTIGGGMSIKNVVAAQWSADAPKCPPWIERAQVETLTDDIMLTDTVELTDEVTYL